MGVDCGLEQSHASLDRRATATHSHSEFETGAAAALVALGGGHRRSERTRGSLSQSSAASTPSVATSIRTGALNPSRSTGSQSSARSAQSRYHPDYFRSRASARRERQGSPASERVPTSPRNLDLRSFPNERVCLCDDRMFPTDCDDCDAHGRTSCPAHALVGCSHGATDASICSKRFHAACAAKHQNKALADFDGSYVCMECSCREAASAPDTPFGELRGPGSRIKKLGRLGLASPDASLTPSAEDTQVRNLLRAMNECIPDDVRNAILDNAPRPYPTAVHMSDDAKQKHAQHGRRWELSMLLYDVQQCSCCGRVQPCHVDPCFPKASDVPFSRKHLMNTYHTAWHCSCDGLCKGSQFYASTRTTVMRQFKLNHGGQTPQEVLGLAAHAPPNATLCKKCFHEVDSSNVHGESSYLLVSQFLSANKQLH